MFILSMKTFISLAVNKTTTEIVHSFLAEAVDIVHSSVVEAGIEEAFGIVFVEDIEDSKAASSSSCASSVDSFFRS